MKKKIKWAMAYVKKYVKDTEFVETSITYHDITVEVLLHPDKLVLITPNCKWLYILDPHGPWDHNKIPAGKVLMMDYLFTVEEIIDLHQRPERFVKTLIAAPVNNPRMYYIEIDGQRVYQTLSGRSWTKARNEYLHERRVGNIKFKHLKMVDPEMKVTDFHFGLKDPGVAAVRALAAKKKKSNGTVGVA